MSAQDVLCTPNFHPSPTSAKLVVARTKTANATAVASVILCIFALHRRSSSRPFARGRDWKEDLTHRRRLAEVVVGNPGKERLQGLGVRVL